MNQVTSLDTVCHSHNVAKIIYIGAVEKFSKI